jgi:hypothetical protein
MPDAFARQLMLNPEAAALSASASPPMMTTAGMITAGTINAGSIAVVSSGAGISLDQSPRLPDPSPAGGG